MRLKVRLLLFQIDDVLSLKRSRNFKPIEVYYELLWCNKPWMGYNVFSSSRCDPQYHSYTNVWSFCNPGRVLVQKLKKSYLYSNYYMKETTYFIHTSFITTSDALEMRIDGVSNFPSDVLSPSSHSGRKIEESCIMSQFRNWL